VFALGAIQRLAEEMATDLHGLRDVARRRARACVTAP
jgi:hypothetical protein